MHDIRGRFHVRSGGPGLRWASLLDAGAPLVDPGFDLPRWRPVTAFPCEGARRALRLTQPRLRVSHERRLRLNFAPPSFV